MKPIEKFKLFDPSQMSMGVPTEECGNYIFLLRPGVKLPEDVIKQQPVFTTVKYGGVVYDVLYTGVTSDSLYERIFKIHLFGNNAGKSTLRKSLGCLWGYKFVYRDKNPNPNRKPKTKYNDEDENKITRWMKENVLVLYTPNSNFEDDEDELINTYNPPLNLDKNHNIVNLEYRKKIKELRNIPVSE